MEHSDIARSEKNYAEHRVVLVVGALALGWSISSSLAMVPHSLAYFNWISGGPRHGYKLLGSSNTDWGQDLLYLQKWYEAHPEARPLYLGYALDLVDPRIFGIDWKPLPVGPTVPGAETRMDDELGPKPGWYCVSVQCAQDNYHRWDYFEELTPQEWIGYTMRIYHITVEQANALRRKYGMAEIAAGVPVVEPTAR